MFKSEKKVSEKKLSSESPEYSQYVEKWNSLIEDKIEEESKKEDFTCLVTPIKDYSCCKRSWILQKKEKLLFSKGPKIILQAVRLIKDEIFQLTEQHQSLSQSILEKINKLNSKIKNRDSNKHWYKQLELTDQELEILYSLANLFLRESRLDDYGFLIQFLAFIDPCQPVFCLGCGIFFCQKQEYEEALLYLEQAIEMDPNSIEAHHYAAICCLEQELDAKAIYFLEKTALLGSEETRSHAQDLLTYMKRGE